MYAQLCKRLSEEAPNFEPPGQPCTFKLLLLNKCRTEFENRAQAFAAFDENVTLSPDEEEKRHLAKCKMLGNIKFIGELGKLEILAESILHRCIQNLLARRAAAEHHEDLECLAQLVRTCGRVLDSERGRGLMDQYFARIETLSSSRDLAPRIRFMLRDTVELRRGGWVPRAAISAEGPVPIHQLRGDEEPPRRDRDHNRDRDRDREPLFRRARPLDDVLAGLSLQPAASLVPPGDKLFGNGFAGRDAFRQRSAPGYFPRAAPQHYGKQPAPPKESGAGRAGKSRVYAVGAAALSDVQMRPAANSLLFTANRLSRPQPSMQPVQPNVLTPAFSSAPPIMKEPAITIKPAPDKKDKPKKDKGVNKEEACRLAVEAVEALAADCSDPRRPPDADALANNAPGTDVAAHAAALLRLQDLQLPEKVLRRVISAVLEHALGSEAESAGAGEAETEVEGDAEAGGKAGARAWAACCVVRAVKRAPLADALRAAESAVAGEAETEVEGDAEAGGKAGARAWAACCVVRAVKRAPLADALRAVVSSVGSSAVGRRRLRLLLAQAVRARLVSLGEVGAWCEGGAHHPLLLDVLQELRLLLPLERLHRLLDESKINLSAYVCSEARLSSGGSVVESETPESASETADALSALEARGLGALVPQLRVQAQLQRQLAAEPAPHALYRWIKNNVEPGVRANAAFVSTLVALVAGHVTSAAGSAHAQADKAVLEREKALVESYAPLLTALLNRPELQLAAVYAVQVHAHHHRYPKGMLLRWFMYLYNLEVCEEDAFLRWREDVTDAYPGKGEALFQVNTWLTWLQQQESEDEEAED